MSHSGAVVGGHGKPAVGGSNAGTGIGLADAPVAGGSHAEGKELGHISCVPDLHLRHALIMSSHSRHAMVRRQCCQVIGG